MSQENVEIVVGQFENVNAREFGAVMDAYADDVVLVLHGDVGGVGGEGAVGKPAVGKWFGDWFNSFDSSFRFEIHEVRDLGDQVLIVATLHARGRSSGVPVTLKAGWIYAVRNGKVVRCDAYSDPEGAFEAVGLVE